MKQSAQMEVRAFNIMLIVRGMRHGRHGPRHYKVLSARGNRVGYTASSFFDGIIFFRHSHEVAAKSQSHEARNIDGDQSQS
jgi:hypothetical protein